MTCDFCGEAEATVHLTEIINDQTRELHLCESCAHEKGAAAGQEFGLAGLLAGLADFGVKGVSPRTKLSCPRCGMTYEDFRKVGRLGCGSCYETFEPYLVPLLKRIHGSTQHVGKSPSVRRPKGPKGPQEDLAQLKESLRKAIAAEAFEEAVRLRDRIRAVEAGSKGRSKFSPKRDGRSP